MILYKGPQAIRSVKNEEMKPEIFRVSFPNCALSPNNIRKRSILLQNNLPGTIVIPIDDFHEEHATNLYTEWNY